MPSWLLTLLIQLAIKFGVPELIKIIPAKWRPQEVIDFLIKYIENLGAAKKEVAIAKAQVRETKKMAHACVGAMCRSDTKGLG